jgi:hypothetical protein
VEAAGMAVEIRDLGLLRIGAVAAVLKAVPGKRVGLLDAFALKYLSFKLTPTGGVISAEASDPEDAKSRDAIRSHFAHIAKEFSSGNFELPMLIHAKAPPGIASMKKLRKKIQYRPEQIDRGGRILIVTQDPKALAAIHQFLRFQIEDHQTGDSTAISDSIAG